MANKYFPTTYDNDTILRIDNTQVNETVYSYVSNNPEYQIVNGGEYYEDIETDEAVSEIEFLNSGVVTALPLAGGLHAPQRPK